MIGECHTHNIIERKGGLVAYQGPRLLGARREVEGLDARRMILCMIQLQQDFAGVNSYTIRTCIGIRKRDETKQYGGTAASTEEHPIRRTKHRSFGFVTLLERDDAVAAMGNMDGAELYGRVLTVNYALPEKIN
ncbi:hypothetical protein NC652_026010 [Populus alba x Populus x berolinensis]|nr:hypothetical protein NC652_026010 [Populus alba x Populus x berolinensis]